VRVGLLACLVASSSFAIMACVSKIAERKQCRAQPLAFCLMGWSTLLMVTWSITLHAGFQIPPKATGAAIGFGVASAVGFLAFLRSIQLGNVTVGWLLMNLACGVPAVISIGVYHEKVSPLKMVAFGLALFSLFLLFGGQRLDARKARLGDRG
jgi:drug/metabolite transporter (DMT)-like permease